MGVIDLKTKAENQKLKFTKQPKFVREGTTVTVNFETNFNSFLWELWKYESGALIKKVSAKATGTDTVNTEYHYTSSESVGDMFLVKVFPYGVAYSNALVSKPFEL